MSTRKAKTSPVRTLQQPLKPTATPPIVNPMRTKVTTTPAEPAADIRRAARFAEETRRHATACAELAALPVQHAHAAGIDVGDATHWVCVEATPDNSDTVREFAAHTPGLRQLVAWLRQCHVTTVALEASGVMGMCCF
jgi:hypothetical protein